MEEIISEIQGASFITESELFIVDIPKKSTPKPRQTSPIFWTRGFFINLHIITPMRINIGATMSKLKETSWPVTVVPILAPRIGPTDCVRVISPELTKLTTITVEALEDWIIAVNTSPTRTPINVFFVHIESTLFIFAPATFSSPSLMSFIP